MADRAPHARAPLAGFALPGRFGAALGKPGLVIEERPWLTKSAAEFGYEMLQLNRPGTRHVADRRGLRR
jgi:hypothetical protein